jgi:acyl-CoA dehydrogenase
MISFDTPKPIKNMVMMVQTVAENMMRPVSRHFDDHEHEVPWDYINFMHDSMKQLGGTTGPEQEEEEAKEDEKKERRPIQYQRLAHLVEMLSWGDTGLYLNTPVGMLGAAAVQATGTPEQKKRILRNILGEKPTMDAMAMTEPHAGSEMPSQTRTTAVRDGDEWVLNGEKIFVTAGHKALVDTEGFVVIWATIDPEAGRAGVRPFVVEAGTPGCSVTKLEHKLGIRASDTATIVLQDCRIPFENILGSPEVKKKTKKGFKGAMATFDASRPFVAASALGVARAALEFLKEKLDQGGVEIRYGLPKVRAGDVTVKITQRAVELLGPIGYSKEHLLEKWFRDAKINDLYEGTGQINRLIVARRILDYSRHELS